MSRLEKTIDCKKGKKNKLICFLFIIVLFLFLMISLTLIDYRVGKFMGIYDKDLISKTCIYMKGLSSKLR